MGAINYRTSDYITLAIEPYERDDPGLVQAIREEVEEYGGDFETALDSYIESSYESDYDNVSEILQRYSFYYFHIVIEPGYYEGFSIDIENNNGIAFDSWEDKRAALKEITGIKRFMIDCAGVGLRACSPGWCTGYSDYQETLEAIDAAVKTMREEVRDTPTWTQYRRAAGEC